MSNILRGHAGFKGKSAYDIAVEMGYEGTIEDWVNQNDTKLEVQNARGSFKNLKERLDNSDKMKADVEALNNADSNLQNQINGLASGSPLAASNTNGMKDTGRVYVNTTDGYLYYWNGSAWTKGWRYQTAEDSETVEQLEKNMKSVKECIERNGDEQLYNKADEIIVPNLYYASTDTFNDNKLYIDLVVEVNALNGDEIKVAWFDDLSLTSLTIIATNVIPSLGTTGHQKVVINTYNLHGSITFTENTKYIVIQCLKAEITDFNSFVISKNQSDYPAKFVTYYKSLIESIKERTDTKLDKNQGAENEGKSPVVGADGNFIYKELAQKSDVQSKIDIYQGAENQGKGLLVDNEGNLSLAEIHQGEGGLNAMGVSAGQVPTADGKGLWSWENGSGNNVDLSSVELGNELITANNWNTTGWSGDLASGFSHIVDQTDILEYDIKPDFNDLYFLEFDVVSPTPTGVPNASTAFTVTLGGSDRFIMYRGGGSAHYTIGLKTKNNTEGLKFIPTSPADPFVSDGTFDGTIKNITLKKILNPANSPIVFKDKDGNNVFNIRCDNAENHNLFVGDGAGKYNVAGYRNVGIGADVLSKNVAGYWNVAVGSQTLENNVIGSRNVAIGHNAMKENVSGDRNYAIGTFALMRNTSGRFNVAIGADTMWDIGDGIGNIGIGSATLSDFNSGNYNVSIGHGSSNYAEGSENVAVGLYALGTATKATKCIAIGSRALYKNGQGAENNIGIGYTALNRNVSGCSNIAIGSGSLCSDTSGKENTSIGHMSGYNMATSSYNTFIGSWAGYSSTGSNNTFIGYSAGRNDASGDNNIIIGANVDKIDKTDSNTIVIGKSTHKSVYIAGKKINFNDDGSITWENA